MMHKTQVPKNSLKSKTFILRSRGIQTSRIHRAWKWLELNAEVGQNREMCFILDKVLSLSLFLSFFLCYSLPFFLSFILGNSPLV